MKPPKTNLRRLVEMLQLGDSFTEEELNQARRDLLQVWHPDRYTHNERLRCRAEEMTKEINAACDTLKGLMVNGHFSLPTWSDPSHASTARRPPAGEGPQTPRSWSETGQRRRSSREASEPRPSSPRRDDPLASSDRREQGGLVLLIATFLSVAVATNLASEMPIIAVECGLAGFFCGVAAISCFGQRKGSATCPGLTPTGALPFAYEFAGYIGTGFNAILVLTTIHRLFLDQGPVSERVGRQTVPQTEWSALASKQFPTRLLPGHSNLFVNISLHKVEPAMPSPAPRHVGFSLLVHGEPNGLRRLSAALANPSSEITIAFTDTAGVDVCAIPVSADLWRPTTNDNGSVRAWEARGLSQSWHNVGVLLTNDWQIRANLRGP